MHPHFPVVRAIALWLALASRSEHSAAVNGRSALPPPCFASSSLAPAPHRSKPASAPPPQQADELVFLRLRGGGEESKRLRSGGRYPGTRGKKGKRLGAKLSGALPSLRTRVLCDARN
eukprot:2717890-Rhodomonas_salina.3